MAAPRPFFMHTVHAWSFLHPEYTLHVHLSAGGRRFPWIDAIMNQLRTWGWMHHLARHSVACFLTRGDLFLHWERGRDVFDKYLIDADHFINVGNWQWLSTSRFFYQYFRCFPPHACMQGMH